MPGKSFRATTIVVPDVASPTILMDAFNAWAGEAGPVEILHVHYYHDLESRTCGYQVIYQESWRTATREENPRTGVASEIGV